MLPINVLNAIRNEPEVSSIFCATANPVEIILLVSEITPAAFNDICSRFGCTLLIDENDWGDKNSRSLRKQLRAGTSKGLGTKLLRKKQHGFGMKILSSLELPDDAQLRSRCIHVPMDESNQTDLKKPWDPEVAKAAGALRSQLLQFRLERYASISPRLIRGAEKLRPRSVDLLSSLLAPLKDLEHVDELLLAFFLLSHDPSTLNLLSPEQSALARALFEFVHIWPQLNFVSVGTLTTVANEMLCAMGERFKLASRKWSDVLTGLGFGERGRSNQGSYLPLHKETIAKIHRLKRSHGQGWPTGPILRELMEACHFCTQRASLTPSDSKG